MAAGVAVLDELRENPAHYQRLEGLGQRLESGFTEAAAAAGIACSVGRVGSMVTPFIGIAEARSFDQVKGADRERFGRQHAAWLEAGIVWPPSQFETAFLSTTHTDEDVDRTVELFARTLSAVSV